MKNIIKKKNPIKRLRRIIKEYFFFKDKRPLFDVNLEGVYGDENFKARDKDMYFRYGLALSETFSPKGIIDLGCANGYLLEYFHEKGIRDIAGIEDAEAAFKYMAPEVKAMVVRADLSKDMQELGIFENNKRYHLVNCTEVGEHIAFKHEDMFLKNIERFVDKYLVLSWADTWEGWHGMDKQEHVNPRSKRYVKKKLSMLNLKYNKRLKHVLVKNLAKRSVYEHWIKRVMVFERNY